MRLPTDISRRGDSSIAHPYLPEGDLRIAHPFKGGIASPIPKVPKGRLSNSRTILCPELTERIGAEVGHRGFDRPCGTYAIADSNPAVNCRAIIESPSGRRRQPVGANSSFTGSALPSAPTNQQTPPFEQQLRAANHFFSSIFTSGKGKGTRVVDSFLGSSLDDASCFKSSAFRSSFFGSSFFSA